MPELDVEEREKAPPAGEMSMEDSELLQRYKEELSDDAELVLEQREKAYIDMQFINLPGGMWEDMFGKDMDQRTLMELDLISPYVQNFIAEWNSNRVGVVFEPDDDQTTEGDSELLNGAYRADFRHNSGKESVDNAVDETAKCGYGCYKFGTKFEDDEDPENNNQRIDLRPINEAYNHVIWDGSATRINKSDARRCVQLIPYTKKKFEKAFSGFTASSAYDPTQLQQTNAFTSSANEIFVANRYEIRKKRETVYVYHNFLTEEIEVYDREQHEQAKDELASDPTRRFSHTRKIVRQRVFKSVFTGDAFIERPRPIAGKYIPIIPIYAFRSYVNGAEWYRGLVRKLIDAQRIFNFVISKLAEISAASGQKTPILTIEQVRGFENIWADRTNASFLPINELRDSDGKIIQTSPVGFLEPSSLDQNTEALLRIVLEVLKEITGQQPLEVRDPEMSGRALSKIFKRLSMRTQEIQDNIANAVEWGGQVYQAIFSEINNSERVIPVISLDGTQSRKRINSMVLDEETGNLVQGNRINGKKFRVFSDIGPQYETEREEEVEKLKGVGDMVKGSTMEAQFMPVIISGIIDKLVISKKDPLKVMNRRFLLAQGLVKPESDEEKQFVQQSQQPQDNGQQELVAAAAQQARSEAMRAEAEARNLDAKSLDNVASAEKKSAETQSIISKTGNERARTLVEIRKQILENAEALPFN